MTDKSEPSIEQLQQRINQNPADAQAYSLLGNSLSRQHRWQEAILAWQEALRRDPEDDHAQFCITLTISGAEPLVKPSAELLKFLAEQSSGYHLKSGQARGVIPLVADAEPPAA